MSDEKHITEDTDIKIEFTCPKCKHKEVITLHLKVPKIPDIEKYLKLYE